MCVIGLTGSLGTGKTAVAAMFGKLGAKVLDADRIAHRLISPQAKCYNQIVRTFGRGILTAGRIDRSKLGNIVFRNNRKLRSLERIIHPEVRKVLLTRIKNIKKRRRGSVVVLDVPLLFESKLDKIVDLAIVVNASKANQMARAVNKLKISKVDAMRRINAQMPLQKKIRKADIIIDNNGSLTNTQKQVKQIWEKL